MLKGIAADDEELGSKRLRQFLAEITEPVVAESQLVQMDTSPKFEHGTISPNVTVECVTIRVMSDSGEPNQELRLQGRIRNISSYPLDDVKCVLSYFGGDGTFLGLDVTSFAQMDDIELGEVAPFDLELKMPVEAVRCVFNVHAKRVLQDIGVALAGYVSSTKSKG